MSSSLSTSESPSSNNELQQQFVKLNVGGRVFATSFANLLRIKDTFFTGYFNDNFKRDLMDDGAYFIDRPYQHFEILLNYMRGMDVTQVLEYMNESELAGLLEEIVFYQLTPMLDILPSKGREILRVLHSDIYIGAAEFDSQFCSSNISLASPNRAKKVGGNGWNACVLGKKSDRFKVRIIHSGLMCLGFAHRGVLLNSVNYQTCGYYLCLSDGYLYSKIPEIRGKTFARAVQSGSIVECEMKGGEIHFKIDGQDYGLAYSNIPQDPQLFPAFDIHDNNIELEFIE